ncbi:MAG: S-layer homology domain-containing protein [Eubacterium sp.]|nr:S-layer homology domain-containing protein [Eubacterium sp.]
MKKKFFKLIPTVLTATMIISAALPAYADTKPAASAFSDVGSSAWYHDAVYWAADKGITAGTTKTTFSPMKSCTRGEIVTFLWRYEGSPKTSLAGNPFKDVTDQYYAEAVMWAKNNKITAGTSENTFSGERTIDRKEAITLLWRLEGSKEPIKDAGFSDIPSGKYYSKAVAWAAENNITNGVGNNQFGPDNPCTRAQIVKFISNTDSVQADDGKTTDDTKKPDDGNVTDDTKKPDDGKVTDDTKKPDDSKVTDDTKKPDTGSTSEDTKQTDTGSTSENTEKSDTSTTPAHEHNWVAITKTVHHDAVTHEEPVYEEKWVEDKPAWEETKVVSNSYYKCNQCGFTTTNEDEMIIHITDEYHSYAFIPEQDQTIYHDAEGHTEKVQTGTKTVVDKQAYDETVTTGYKCSICGATK